jgi:predicted Holliday junction resolvase-like endonuclease
METASFTGILRTLFYIVLFYYIFKFVMRLFLPVVLKKAVEKAEQNMRQHHQQSYSNRGETINEQPDAERPRETKKVGEYVDFEEIE